MMLYNFEKLRFTFFYINSLFDQIENINYVYSEIFKNEPTSLSANKVTQQKIAQSDISIDELQLSASLIVQNNRLDMIIDGNAESDPISIVKIEEICSNIINSSFGSLPKNPVRIAIGLILNKTTTNTDESVNIAKYFFPGLSSLENIGELGIRINQIQEFDNIFINAIISVNTVKQIKQKIEQGQPLFFHIPQTEMQDACLIEFDFNTQPESNLEGKDIQNIFANLKENIFKYLKHEG